MAGGRGAPEPIALGAQVPFATHGPREACGVVGVLAPAEAMPGRLAVFALHALQHRGQESAGVAALGPHGVRVRRGMGLVAEVFAEADVEALEGELAVGHVRYSTRGRSDLLGAQPFVLETALGPLALAHNGNLTNARRLRGWLLARGTGLTSDSDSELLAQLLALPLSALRSLQDQDNGASDADCWEARLSALMHLAEGAFSLTVMTADAVYALRDPLGLRPLHLGTLPGGLAAASETCAFGPMGATPLREVAPGEIVALRREGLRSWTPAPRVGRAFCAFEHVYFARPDSLLDGRLVHATRQRMGEILAREQPAAADLVVGVPDSALAAAQGFARAAGLRYGEGLIRTSAPGRTFIQPTAALREAGVRLKYSPLEAHLLGQRVVLVDDSIVRGTTVGPLVRLLREAGAAEVHVRVSSPPVAHPCYMGVDMADRTELIASHLDPAAIAARIGADSCAYLSLAGLVEALGPHHGAHDHCLACFSGRYPLAVADLAGGS